MVQGDGGGGPSTLQALFTHVLREWARKPGDATLVDVHRFVHAWARFVRAETDEARLAAARSMVSFPVFISLGFRRPAVTRAVRALAEQDAAGRDRRAQVLEWLAHALCDVWQEEACRPRRLRRGQRGPYIKALSGGFTRSGPDQPAVPIPKGTIIPVMPVFRLDVVGVYRFLRHRTKKRAAEYLLKTTGYWPKELGTRRAQPARAARHTASFVLASRPATSRELQAGAASAEAQLEAEEHLCRLLAVLPADKRELVALRAAGESYEAIAARLGYATAGAARTAMCRVRADLRRAGVGV